MATGSLFYQHISTSAELRASMTMITSISTKKASKVPVTAQMWGESTGDQCIPSWRTSNAESISKSWRHNADVPIIWVNDFPAALVELIQTEDDARMSSCGRQVKCCFTGIVPNLVQFRTYQGLEEDFAGEDTTVLKWNDAQYVKNEFWQILAFVIILWCLGNHKCVFLTGSQMTFHVLNLLMVRPRWQICNIILVSN